MTRHQLTPLTLLTLLANPTNELNLLTNPTNELTLLTLLKLLNLSTNRTLSTSSRAPYHYQPTQPPQPTICICICIYIYIYNTHTHTHTHTAWTPRVLLWTAVTCDGVAEICQIYIIYMHIPYTYIYLQYVPHTHTHTAWTPRVLLCSAVTSDGVAEICQTMFDFRRLRERRGDWTSLRARQRYAIMWRKAEVPPPHP
jgi:hypothetical protein